MLMFLLIGAVVGALTGVPIGPVNVAVIDAAYRHTMRRAIMVGLGGACGDLLYSGLGVVGVTPILNRYPSVPPILYAVSGCVLLVYGFMTARSQPPPAVAPAEVPHAEQSTHMRREMWSGYTVGLALIVLNPAAIVTWVVLVGSFIPTGTTHLDGIFFAVGVFIGSFAWFSLVAYLTHRGKHVLGDKAAWIPRVIGVGLMVYAIWLIARAVKFVVA